MNILRWKRKSKNKIKFKSIILVIFSLIMTTFAWYAYTKVIDPTLNIHIASWDMEYYIGADKQTNPIGINIPVLYPAMTEQSVRIDIKNNGETLVDIEYLVESITIAGVEYQVLPEETENPTGNYVIMTPPIKEMQTVRPTDPDTGEEIETQVEVAKGVITNDITKFPFTVELDYSPQVEAESQGYLTIRVNWIGDNAKLDSEWGYIVGQYLAANPTATSAMSIGLRIDSYQAYIPLPGEVVEEEVITLPSTAETTPFLPTGFTRVPGTSLHNGLVVKDATGNEYVWIEVPRNSTVYPNAGLSLDLDTLTDTALTDAYNAIEADLHAYTADYREGTSSSDTYYSDDATGLTSTEYEALKQKMLKSVYKNGGFYIGRYEAGLENTYRIAAGTANQTPVIKPHAYPYNWVTCKQAQTAAARLTTAEYTSSLMFGVQWDLVMKYLETSGATTQAELKEDSTEWGNYWNNEFDITNSEAKYFDEDEVKWEIAAPYSKMEDEGFLLTLGANSAFVKQNIYDLSGNLYELTLEKYSDSSNLCVDRGGGYDGDGIFYSTSVRSGYNYANTFGGLGFRVSLY